LTIESDKPRIVLDTKPLIKLFAKEEGWQAVQKILSGIEEGKDEAAICVVTLTEIYYKYLQEKREDLGRARVQDIRHAMNVKELEIDEETAVRAGEFKGKYGVPVADAFIAAAACLEGSIVISDDPHFRRMAEIKALTEEEFLSCLG